MTYKVQIDDLVRDATAEEIAIFKAKEIEEAENKAKTEAKQIAKAAILDRLGLTDDELKTILG